MVFTKYQLLWQRLASNTPPPKHATQFSFSKRRSSFHLASSLAQFARVSSGLSTFKSSTKRSIKVFNTLLSEVSEGEAEEFEQTNFRHMPVMRQSTCSSVTDSEYGLQNTDKLRGINQQTSDIKKNSSPGSNSLFSRFFNWRKSSCEDNLIEPKEQGRQDLNNQKERSVSEEELLAFIERHPNFEGRIQLRDISGNLMEVDNTGDTRKTQHPSTSLGNMISRQESTGSWTGKNVDSWSQKEKIKHCDSFPTTGKTECRSGWQTKCSLSFSCGDGVDEPSASKLQRRSITPLRSDSLHIKLQRYKTFHGSSKKELHYPKHGQRQNLLFQVLHMLLSVSRFLLLLPRLFCYVSNLHFNIYSTK